MSRYSARNIHSPEYLVHALSGSQLDSRAPLHCLVTGDINQFQHHFHFSLHHWGGNFEHFIDKCLPDIIVEKAQ